MKFSSFVLALAVVLIVGETASAQGIDLANFGLGPIAPFSLELDGNLETPEFGAINSLGLWVINPTTYCKSLVTAPIGFEESTRAGTFYIATVQRIAGRDHIVYIDIDSSDGRLPIIGQKIESECYPLSVLSSTRR
jgi:hypothetical protein